MNSSIQILNRRLGERLGLVCGGSTPRFKWCWAPDMPWFTYDLDDRTLIKRSWADAPAPDGNPIGAVWLLGEWRKSTAFDHHGFGEGVRIPFIKDADYAPYFETALGPGQVPTDALTANYCWAIDRQMSVSFERIGERSMDHWLGEEKYGAEKRNAMERQDNLERARKVYDDNTGALGNCLPGTAGGFLSFGGVDEVPASE